MSNQPNHPLRHPDASAEEDVFDPALDALNLFVDGELALENQGPLFAHMAECLTCRRDLEHLMRFRRMTRFDHLPVSPAVDDAFFKRLDAVRVNRTRVDRASDRRPLWQHKTSVSIRAAALAAGLVFLAGLFFPSNTQPVGQGSVVGFDETIEVSELSTTPTALATLYVFYPGLTVEAVQHED